MPWKDTSDFHKDYPNGYSENGDVYDGAGNRIGYVDGRGDYHITDDSANDGQEYHNNK